MFDKEKIEQGIRLLLEGIGEDVNREGLKDTPDRVARMYEELCAGMEQDPKTHLSKTFACDNENVVIEKDITEEAADKRTKDLIHLLYPQHRSHCPQ